MTVPVDTCITYFMLPDLRRAVFRKKKNKYVASFIVIATKTITNKYVFKSEKRWSISFINFMFDDSAVDNTNTK